MIDALKRRPLFKHPVLLVVASVLGAALLFDAAGPAHADVLCNNGKEEHPSCHPIGPPKPSVCESDPGGPSSQLAYSWMCDEYGYRAKLAIDNVTVQDPTAAVKVGYGVCGKLPPVDSTDTSQFDSGRAAAVSMVASSGVVASPGNADQFVTDAIEWLC